ncbi:MAG TPA: ABC transporter permease [Candidatus Marinimicrobia bacterium]|nr:ABC transporter permease [Candidatus Neomarinimicrobiota bacterium]
MINLKLAWRNIRGAGIRAILNSLVLSLVIVIIIWMQGLYDGMSEQMSRAMIDMELGGGQLWHPAYDPYNPMELPDAHQPLSDKLKKYVAEGKITPILVVQGTMYPHGRMQAIFFRGIDPSQDIIQVPSRHLDNGDGYSIPVIIGKRMAENSNLKEGETFTIQWRNAEGVYDAADAKVIHIMDTPVSTVDIGQVWMPLNQLQSMMALPDAATLIISKADFEFSGEIIGWDFKPLSFLLKEVEALVKSKQGGGMLMSIVLLFLALIAIFDTQLLAVFRRKREIGMLIAMGMTPRQVGRLFTLEGSLYGIIAIAMSAIYGIPLMIWTQVNGLYFGDMMDDFGMALGNTLYPIYTVSKTLAIVITIFLIVLFVSYYPARKIAKMNPTDALRTNT